MAFQTHDNVRETFTGAGSTTITLGGAAATSRPFSSKFSAGDTFWGTAHAISSGDISVGKFTYNGTTVTQTEVKYSSNSDAAVVFPLGAVCEIYNDIPAFVLDRLNLVEESLASATTTDLGSIKGYRIQLTGTTAPTSFGTFKNKERLVRYTGAGLTITASSTIVLPGGAATMVLSTNDLVYLVSDDSSTPIWRIVWRIGAAPVVTVKPQKFTSSGTYTPSPGMLYCIIESVGGGGGGAGVASSSGVATGGGGGGSGSYSRLLASAATIGASKTVTIGAGGNGGAAGANNGSAGGDTSLGSLCIGKGGSGGTQNGAGSGNIGGAGGVAGTGDYTPAGTPGSAGTGGSVTSMNVQGGVGGCGPFGGGGGGTMAGNTGASAGLAAPVNTGGGGGGAVSNNNASTWAGGNGGSGVVIITEFCAQ